VGDGDARTSGAALIVMVGAPGAGKSFLARAIASTFDAELVQSDAVRKRLFPQPAYTSRERQAVYAVCRRMLTRALAAGRRVVFDATNVQERSRLSLLALAGQQGARAIIVVAYAPEDVIRARLAGRRAARDPRDLSDADWDVYLRIRAAAQPVGRPHLVANTSAAPTALLRVLRRMLEGG
jgi:predicted kinase